LPVLDDSLQASQIFWTPLVISPVTRDLSYLERSLVRNLNPSKNRRSSEVGGGTLYHKVFLSRRVAHTKLGTVILLYRCELF
jgi:hypothetical protein